LSNAAPDEPGADLATVSEPPFEAAAIENDDDVWLIPDATAAAVAQPAEEKAAADSDDAIEIDLSDLLGDVTSASGHDRGRAEYDRGVALRDEGRVEEAIAAFQNACREPRLRFDAAAAIARLHRQRGELDQAVDWFERAAQEPPPTPDASHSLLYELAEALESLGEVGRALAVCLELQADAGAYRDVAVRIARLAGAQTRG